MSEDQATESAAQESNAQEVSMEATESTGIQEAQESVAGILPDQEQAVAYTPNYKFKVMDEEKEVDEWLRPVISSPDIEKKVRELYEKAYGLDHVKPKYEGLKQSYQTLTGDYNNIAGDLKKIGGYIQNKDYGSFFNTFGIGDKELFEHAMQRMKYYELPPQERSLIDKQNLNNQRLVEYEMKLKNYEEEQQNYEIGQVSTALENTLRSPQINNIVTNFDTRAGQPGSFRNNVIAYADSQVRLTGRVMAPQEAVQSFINQFGLANYQEQGESFGQGSAQAAHYSTPKAPTIPTMRGGSTSPVKAKVRSIEDIRKLTK